MSATAVERLHHELSELLSALRDAGEPSLHTVADDNSRKVLLMAAASYFERCMTDAVLDFVAESTAEGHVLTHLVRNKVVRRQYHTWFNWEDNNANSFFGLFGAEFRDHVKAVVADDDELASSIRAFLEVGRERNRLVHQDFASLSLEKTSREIYELYLTAMKFVEWFPEAIRQYSGRLPGIPWKVGDPRNS